MSLDPNYRRCFKEIADIRSHPPEITPFNPLDVPAIIARNWLQRKYYAQFLSKVGVIFVSACRVISDPPPIVRIYIWGPECFAEWEMVNLSGYFTHLWFNGNGDTLGSGDVSPNAHRLNELMKYPEVNEVQRICSCTSKLSPEQLVRLAYDVALNRKEPTGSVKIAAEEAFADVVKNTLCSAFLKGLPLGLFQQSLIVLPRGNVQINYVENPLEGSSEPYMDCLKVGPSNNLLTYHAICFMNLLGFKATIASLSLLLSTHLLRVTVEVRRLIKKHFRTQSEFCQCKLYYEQGKYEELTEEQLYAFKKLRRLQTKREHLAVAIKNTARSVKSLMQEGAIKRIGREFIAIGNFIQTPQGTMQFDPEALQEYYWAIMKQMHGLHMVTLQLRAKRRCLSGLDQTGIDGERLAFKQFSETRIRKEGSQPSVRPIPEDLFGRRHTENAGWDVFVCHASEDKETVARPLAEALTSKGLRVWHDEFSLKLGDSLRRSIDLGLSRSKYGIVILSRNLFAQEWPQRELDGLVAKEMSGRKMILPIWHQVDKAYVEQYSPTLADKFAISTSRGLPAIVDAILQVIRPEFLKKQIDSDQSSERS